MNDGVLVAFEGIDGTGKSTQIALLAEYLKSLGHKVVLTREPTDGQYGKKIRELYTCRDTVTLEQELELFIADRKDHVERVIQPSLAGGMVVLTDRYFYSTAAYQGAAGVDPEEIFKRNRFAPIPDLVILLTMEVDESLRRIEEQRQETLNDFEQREQLEKVAAIFATFTDTNIVRVEAAADIDVVQRQIRQAVLDKTRVEEE